MRLSVYLIKNILGMYRFDVNFCKIHLNFSEISVTYSL